MELKEKIEFMLSAAKKSCCVFYNGNICLFNEHETFSNFEKENSLYLDTPDGDDFYTCIDFNKVIDIKLNDGVFHVFFNDKSLCVIIFATIEELNF